MAIVIDITANDRATATIQKAAQAVGDLGKAANTSAPALDNLGMGSQRAAGGLGDLVVMAGQFVAGLGLAAAFTEAGKASIQLAMNMEQTRMAFTQLLGSASKANAYLEELRQFSEATPFQFTQLTDAARRLMAMGFAAEQVTPMLRDIGDAVAAMGGGGAEIDGITLALGQMQLKGKVSAEEMLQLSERGVAGWRYVAEALGVTTAEAQKLSEKGLIPVNTAIQAILAGMREDFGGMMAQQAETAAGRMSTLVDKTEALGLKIGDMLLPAVSRLIETGFGLVDWTTTAATSFDMLARMASANSAGLLDFLGVIDSYEAQARKVASINGNVTAGWLGSADATAMARDEYQRSVTVLLGATQTYDEFLASVNKMTPAQREILRQQGYINEAWYENASAVRDAGVAAQQAALVDFRAMERQLMNTQTAVEGLTEAGFAYDAKEQERINQTMLQIGLQGQIQKAQQDEAAILDEINAKQVQLATTTGLTRAEREKLAGEIAALKEKAEGAASGFAAMITQMLYQQASAGLSADASLELARTLGLISEQDYVVSQAMQNIRREFDAGKIGPEEYAKRVAELRDRIAELQSKDITITTTTINTTRIVTIEERQGGTSAIRRDSGGERAIGGPVVAGQSYAVGEHGPEMFTPVRSGVISPSGNTSTTGEIVINVYGVTDPAAVAAEVQKQLDKVAANATRRR